MNFQEKIQTFLETISQKPKLIVIYGPTACGKTALSIEIAQMLQTEIISTDSRQIFCGMDIGTGKITESEKQGIVHHMLDIVTPDQEYTVADFKKEAENHIETLLKSWKIPLLVWGTGLYIDALIYENKIGAMPSDPELRQKIEVMPSDELYETLQKIDPEYASELHPNNRPYLERALEIKLLTGKSKKDFRQEKVLKYDVLFLTPYDGDREKLYTRINTRVQEMFEQRLEQEVRWLIEQWYRENDFGMRSIGYQEFFPYFAGEISIWEVKNKIQQYSRNYAKRQLTWFSKYTKNISEL